MLGTVYPLDIFPETLRPQDDDVTLLLSLAKTNIRGGSSGLHLHRVSYTALKSPPVTVTQRSASALSLPLAR